MGDAYFGVGGGFFKAAVISLVFGTDDLFGVAVDDLVATNTHGSAWEFWRDPHFATESYSRSNLAFSPEFTTEWATDAFLGRILWAAVFLDANNVDVNLLVWSDDAREILSSNVVEENFGLHVDGPGFKVPGLTDCGANGRCVERLKDVGSGRSDRRG